MGNKETQQPIGKKELSPQDIQVLSHIYIKKAKEISSEPPVKLPSEITDKEAEDVLGVSTEDIIYGKGIAAEKAVIRTLSRVNNISREGLNRAASTVVLDPDKKRVLSRQIRNNILPKTDEERLVATEIHKWIQNVDEVDKAISRFQLGLDGQPMKVVAEKLPDLWYVLESLKTPDEEANKQRDFLTKVKDSFSVLKNLEHSKKAKKAEEFFGLKKNEKVKELLRIKPIYSIIANATYWSLVMQYAFQMMEDADTLLQSRENHIQTVDDGLPSTLTLKEHLESLHKLHQINQNLVFDLEEGKEASFSIIKRSLPQRQIPVIRLEDIPPLTDTIEKGDAALNILPKTEAEYRRRQSAAYDILQRKGSAFDGAIREYRSSLATHAIIDNRFFLYIAGQEGVNTILSALRLTLDWSKLVLVEKQNRSFGRSDVGLIKEDFRSLGAHVINFQNSLPQLEEYAEHPEELGLQPKVDK